MGNPEHSVIKLPPDISTKAQNWTSSRPASRLRPLVIAARTLSPSKRAPSGLSGKFR